MKTFELYYNTGGHGGPYNDLILAERRAADLIKGDTSRTLTSIEIRPNDSKAFGGYGAKHPGSRYIEFNKESGEFSLRTVYLDSNQSKLTLRMNE